MAISRETRVTKWTMWVLLTLLLAMFMAGGTAMWMLWWALVQVGDNDAFSWFVNASSAMFLMVSTWATFEMAKNLFVDFRDTRRAWRG